MRKSQQRASLLHHEAVPRHEAVGGGSESYSSNSSFTDSYSDSSDLANWEEYVAEDGSLFYAEYLPRSVATKATTTTTAGETVVAPEQKHTEFKRSLSLRMGKKARKQQQQKQQQQEQEQQKRHQHSQQQNQQKHKQQQEQFLFSHIKTNVACKQLELIITASDRYRFGRRSTAVESILGFRAVAFPDQIECLMVDEFIHDMPTVQHPNESIKRGDWFKSLDDIEIRTSNVDDLLLQFLEPTKVTLKFVGSRESTANEGAASGPASAQTLQKVTDFNSFAKIFERIQLGDTTKEAESPGEILPFAMMIIPPQCYQLDQHKDSFFYYPEDTNLNFLYKARGSFLTLNAVLSDELHTPPLLSKLLVKGVRYFVSYRRHSGFLMLFAFSEKCQTMKEATMRTEELMRYLQFSFPTLRIEQLAPSANGEAANVRAFLHSFSHVQRVRVLAVYRQKQVLFEELLPESRILPLPKEAQLRIFDALSEMEAMDYRNWNDEPLNTHREFFIHGSALYYEHFLLASQLPVETRLHIDAFLRCRGIFDFIAEHNVKELYVWQEIELPNATGRYFLTVCSRNHLILTAILKIFDPTPDVSSSDRRVPPSLFYVEEIEETLDHLIQCGIESLATFWAVSNKRPEILEKLDPQDATDANSNNERPTSKFETLLKQKLTPATTAAAASGSQAAARSSEEETHLCSSLGGFSIHSQTPSEDDATKRRSNDNADESDSGSDWEEFCTQRPLHNSEATCQGEVSESLLREINNVLPINISPGSRNSIYYYIYVDNGNGTIFCPTKINHTKFPFMRELRLSLHAIHDVLQSTKKRQQKRSQNKAQGQTKPSGCGGPCSGSRGSGSGPGPRSSCGDDDGDREDGAAGGGCGCDEGSDDDFDNGETDYKEHGMTITVRDKLKDDNGGNTKGPVRGRFAVAGRLFISPPREVYICHRPDVPQNLVEMAFRLSFLTLG